MDMKKIWPMELQPDGSLLPVQPEDMCPEHCALYFPEMIDQEEPKVASVEK